MNKSEISAFLDEWNSTLETGDPKRVAALYADDAILLPTLSGRVCRNRDEIEEYFEFFLAGGPAGKIDEVHLRLFEEIAISSGVYTFTFNDGSVAQARFTFVYKREGDHWVIIEHHSSRMP